MSLEDYNAIEETLYLMGNPHNAKNLLASLEQYERAAFTHQDGATGYYTPTEARS